MPSASHVDLYQLTSLVPHWDAGLADAPVTFTFFTRRLPRDPADGRPTRAFLLFTGLARALHWLHEARFDDEDLRALRDHPALGPALAARPELFAALRDWRFRGTVRAPREGTPLTAGPAVHLDGRPVVVDGVRPAASTPFLQVRTDLLTAKLIETPVLSIVNHMTMVASKAARVVHAARELGDRTVLEFGQRRTHPQAAVDASLAAWIAGCDATSNVAAHVRHGIPVAGTMDHFAIQAWERPDQPLHATERAYFAAFHAAYPGRDVLLVDTYDAFGERTGIRSAVAATGGRLSAIRLDSAITVESVHRARRLLDDLGAPQARIVVSGGLDEHRIRELGDAPIDGYGIGERIVTSPDAPVGVGAIAKLGVIDGRPTMKLSRGSGKASLPGDLQVWRTTEGDCIGLVDEDRPGEPLLQPVWDGRGAPDLPSPSEARDHAAACLATLPEARLVPREVTLPVTDALADLVRRCVRRTPTEAP